MMPKKKQYDPTLYHQCCYCGMFKIEHMPWALQEGKNIINPNKIPYHNYKESDNINDKCRDCSFERKEFHMDNNLFAEFDGLTSKKTS